MSYSYDPVGSQVRPDFGGGRIRGVLGMLQKAAGAVGGALSDQERAYQQWEEAQRQAAQEAKDEADAVEAGVGAQGRAIPDVTRKPSWSPSSEAADVESSGRATADAALESLQEEDFSSQVRPGGKEYKEADLAFPGGPAGGRRQPTLPTASDVSAASPAARADAAADRRARTAAAGKPSPAARAAATRSAGEARQAARDVGINADPAKVEADRKAAEARVRQPAGKDPVQEMGERKETAALAQDTRRYNQDISAYDTKMAVLRTQLDNAIENGNVEQADRIAAEMQAIPKPQATSRMLGGKTPQELEEPVAATLDKLPAESQAALRNHFLKRHLPGGRAPTPAEMARANRLAGEDLINSYDGLDPADRLSVMADDADRVAAPAPMSYGGGDQSTPGGVGFGIGDNAKNEDMDPKALRMAGRDVDSGAPMVNKPGQRGGTFVQNPDGTWSRRAPSPAQMEAVPGEKDLPINPPAMTREWVDGMKIAGQALGLDASQFDNEGQFIAAAQKLLERHRQLEGIYDTVPVATGGYRRTPNDATKARMQKRDLALRVKDFVKMYPDAPADELYALADAGDADGLRERQTEHRRLKETARAQAARDFELRQTETRLMNNPNVAPAMFVQDLNQAGNDPQAIANAYRRWQRPGEAARVTALDNQRRAAEMDNEQKMAEIDAMGRRGKGDEDKPSMPQAYLEGVNQIVNGAIGADGQDVVDPETSVNSFVMHENQYRTNTGGKPVTAAEGAYMLAKNAIGRGVPLGHPVVSFALAQILPTLSPRRPVSDDVDVGPIDIDSKRTTFIKEARRLVVGDKFSDDELGRWFETQVRS
jgi:hypothetical protein